MQNVHPRKSGPGGAPCFGQFGDVINISERLAGALGTSGGCGLLAATRATVGLSEPSSLADFLGPVPRRLVLVAPSQLLQDLGVYVDFPYLLVHRGGSIPWSRCGSSGGLRVRSNGPGPKPVPLLLDQLFPYKVKDLSDRQRKRDQCDPHRPLVALEALAIESHQIVSFLLLREVNLEGVGKRHRLL